MKPTPSGWLMVSGVTSRSGMGMSLGRYSPITFGGRSPGSLSSSSSSVIVFRSTMGCRPVTWWAYGLPCSLDRYQTSDQPIRSPW